MLFILLVSDTRALITLTIHIAALLLLLLLGPCLSLF